MVCAGHGGSPLFLRVIDVSGDWITTLDGSGEAGCYRIVPLDVDEHGRATMPAPQRSRAAESVAKKSGSSR
jgi:hypothetical protein